MFLKQNAVGDVELNLGPFVDATDGFTAETGLTIAQANIRVGKADGTIEQTGNSFGGEHSENGYYYCKINGTDCDQIGPLQIMVSVSGARPVMREFYVLPAGVYTAITGTSVLDANSVLSTAALENIVAATIGTEGDLEAILAVLAGVATVDNTNPSAPIVTFKKRNGTTTKITLTYSSTDGVRTASTVS